MSLKHGKIAWSVNSDITGDLQIQVVKKQEAALSFVKCIEVVLQVKTQELDLHLS